MIRSIRSSRPTFKALRFKSGLNLIVADRSDNESSDRKTRNGAGKSSLVDIIRFMLGGDIRKGRDVLSAREIADDVFSIDFDLIDAVKASRSPSGKGKVFIDSNVNPGWPVRPVIDEKAGVVWFSAKAWSNLIGQVFFGLPDDAAIEPGSNLSANSCLAYFCRRSRDGGFQTWTLTHNAQSLNKQAVPLFYLLGLDADAALKFVRLDETKAAAAELRKAVKQGLLAQAIGSRGHLANELVRARRKVERLNDRLSGLNVLEFYGAYEREAANADRRIREINDLNFLDERLIADIESAIDSEAAPALPDVHRLYKDAGVSLPGVSLRRYEDVEKFHEAVVRNRRAHLQAELRDARERIRTRSAERAVLLSRLSDVRDLLSKGLSLGDYRKLESERVSAEAVVAELSNRLELANRFENLKVDMRSKKLDAERALRNVIVEQQEIILEAIKTFQEISAEIYDKPAEFNIEITPSGPRFTIKEPAIASEGVNNMQIFTFDLMLTRMAHKSDRWPGFLVHDSHLFDGVDGRQIGRALSTAKSTMDRIGGQYIVTMNSDDLEKTQRESSLNFEDDIIEPRLADDETGGLFGFRFERDLSEDDGESAS